MEKSTKELVKDLIDKGKTQTEIAEKCGISQSTLSRIANGLHKSEYSRVHGKILNLHKQIMQSS